MKTHQAVSAFFAAKQGIYARSTRSQYLLILGILGDSHDRLPDKPEPLELLLAAPTWALETRLTYQRRLATFYNWLTRRGLIKHNPMPLVERPRLRQQIHRSLNTADLSHLLHEARHTPAMKAFLWLLIDTGLRVSEAWSVGNHIQDTDGFLKVDGKVGVRLVPVSDRVLDAVRFVLPWPWSNGSIAGASVRKAFKAAGFSGKHASAQSIRHAFVRAWDGDMTALRDVMGWTSLKMLSRYRPYDMDRAKREHDKQGLLTKVL